MAKYALEFRVVEVHEYDVEAKSKDEAIDKVYDLDLEPNFVNPICYEVDDIWEAQTEEEMLTPAEYAKLRFENIAWLSGKDKVGMP